MEQRAPILVKPYALGVRAASRTSLCMLLCLLFSVLSACGQRGPLTLPNDSDFKQRATLPDIVRRQLPDFSNPAANNPAPNTASPMPATPVAPSPMPAASSAPPAVQR